MTYRIQSVVGLFLFLICPVLAVGDERHFTARQAFDYSQTVLFCSDFADKGFDKLNLSVDARYRLPQPEAGRLEIVDAPNMQGKVAAFTVPRAENSFRAEISLPSEKGFQERHYQIKVLVPDDWQIDDNPGADIIMQWHAVPGDWRPTYPNLAIAIDGSDWTIRQNYGDPKTKPTRTRTTLRGPLHRGVWATWTIHARWSPGEDGLIRVWRNGDAVYRREGPNVYGTIGKEYTPYLKCGIYHPEWNIKGSAKRRDRFQAEVRPVTRKQVFVQRVVIATGAADVDSLLSTKTSK